MEGHDGDEMISNFEPDLDNGEARRGEEEHQLMTGRRTPREEEEGGRLYPRGEEDCGRVI